MIRKKPNYFHDLRKCLYVLVYFKMKVLFENERKYYLKMKEIEK